MKVLVCGSRDFTDRNIICSMLTGLYAEESCGWMLVTMEPFVVIEGGASGTDAAAAWWAKESPMHPPSSAKVTDDREMPVDHAPYPADWRTHHPDWCDGNCPGSRKPRPYCSFAGFRRNQQMLDEGKPDLVLAFVNKPLPFSKGTGDMVRRARAAGIRTYVVEATA